VCTVRKGNWTMFGLSWKLQILVYVCQVILYHFLYNYCNVYVQTVCLSSDSISITFESSKGYGLVFWLSSDSINMNGKGYESGIVMLGIRFMLEPLWMKANKTTATKYFLPWTIFLGLIHSSIWCIFSTNAVLRIEGT
jgi:hypothetical protein